MAGFQVITEAELVSISVERMSKIRAWMEEPKCIHEEDDDGVLWEDKLFDTPEHRPDFKDENEALHNVLDRVLADIDDERAAEVISLRFGLDGADSQTLEEIGELFGLTRERIRQIEGKAIRQLAHPSRSATLAQFYYPYKYSQHSKRAPEKIVSRIHVKAANNKTAGLRESSTSNNVPIEPVNNITPITVKKKIVESDNQLQKTSSERAESKVPHILLKGDRVTYLTNKGRKRAGVIVWTDGKVVKITDSGSTVSKNVEDVIAADNADNSATPLLTTQNIMEADVN
jgi:RNA polymerase sigma factor (sigma-70 family)